MKAATRLATSSGLPLGELDRLVRAIGECRSKAEEDRIITAEVDTLKQRLADPRLDKSRGREYMVRVMYCEMLGHDVSFAYIPVLQMASDSNLLNKKAAYLCLAQLLDHSHELLLLAVNTLLSDLNSDNYIVVGTALVAAAKLIGPDLVNAVLPAVIQRTTHPKEAVRKKALMALLHFHSLDPGRSGPLAGVELERHFRTGLCDREPSVMGATLNGLIALAADNPAPYRSLIPSLTSILKQVIEHKLPKAYDYHRFPAPFIQIKLLKLLRLLAAGDQTASDNVAAVVGGALRRAAAGGGHTIGHAIVYEAVRTVTAMTPQPALLAAAAEAVSVLLRSPAHNLKYCGLTALAAITRVSPKYAQEHQLAVIDCLEDPDETLKLKTLQLLVTMTKANNVQVVVERLMAFLRASSAAGGDEVIRRHIAGQVVELAEKYAPDTTWFLTVMAEVFEVGGDVLPLQLAHNLCRLVAEQDGTLHATAVQMFLQVLDRGGTPASAAAASGGGSANAPPPGSKPAAAAAAPLPDILLCCICWVLGEYGSLGGQLAPPARASIGQIMDKLCAAVASAQAGPTVRAHLLTALTKLAGRQALQQGGGSMCSSIMGSSSGFGGANLLGGLEEDGGQPGTAAAAGQPGAAALLVPEAAEQLRKARASRSAELQQRGREAEALLRLPAHVLAAVLPFDSACEELEGQELEAARGLTFLQSYVNNAAAAGAAPYNPPPEFSGLFDDAELDDARSSGSPQHHHGHGHQQQQQLRFDAYEKAAAPVAAVPAVAAAAGGGGAFGSGSSGLAPAAAPAAAAAAGGPGSSSMPGGGGQQQPALQLRGAGKGRWGPAEFASSSSSRPAAEASAAAAPAAGASHAAPRATDPPPQQYKQQQQQQRILSERDKQLAASLFGAPQAAAGSGGDGGIRGRSGHAAAAKPPAVVADLLGGDLIGGDDGDAQPAAAAAAAGGGSGGGGLDLLMEMDAAPPAAAAAGGDLLSGLDALAAAAPTAAAAPAPGAAASLDLLLGSPVGLTPAAAAAVPPGLAGLDLMLPGGLQQQQQPGAVPAAAQQQQPSKGPGQPMAMRGGQPAKSAQAAAKDPFGDLLG